MREVDTLPPNDWDEQFEKVKEAWVHVKEQIMLVIETWRTFLDMMYDSEPKYIQTELKFPEKKKRGTMSRRRRERRANE